MILNFNNKPCIVQKRLKNYGPEPHYECLCGDVLLNLAVQKSGVVVQVVEFTYKTLYFYIDENLDNSSKWALHREDNLPAVIYNDSVGTMINEEFWIHNKCVGSK